MSHQSYREESRKNWGKDSSNGNLTLEQINTGCLLRIADAVELMAKRHKELIDSNEYLQRRHREMNAEIERLKRQRAALRGAITRLKRAKADREKAKVVQS